MTISTENVNAGSDSPRLARAQIKETIDTVNNLETSAGAAGVGFIQSGTGAAATTVQAKLRGDLKTVRDYGALGAGADESTAANAMLTAHNMLVVPAGFTLVAKNVQLSNSSLVIVEGSIKLPSGCSDDDRILYADQKTDLHIEIRDLDGNYAGQSGNIGTHLIYLTRCPDAYVNVRYAHDHYIASGAAMPSNDTFRNSSTGAIWLYECDRAEVNIGLLEHWGREGLYLEQCDDSIVEVGHCQGHASRNTEYSGVQVKGNESKLIRASVDFAGASGVGFDTVNGTISNIISTRTRANNGVNFGHPSFPASGSVASNIVVDGCYGFGIGVAASTIDLSVNGFSVQHAGIGGISWSDGSLTGKLSNGQVQRSGRYNLNASVSQVQCSNVKSETLGALSAVVDIVSGAFIKGETVTTATGSATVEYALPNLAGTQQILFFDAVTGSITATQAITGGTSLASGTVNRADVPVQRNETGGGLYIDESRYFSGSQGNQTRFPDGTAIMQIPVTVAGTAATLVTSTTNYSSNVLWASAPSVVASIQTASSTDGFVISMMRASSTTSVLTIKLKTDVTQNYGIAVFAIGRWK